MNMQGHRLVEFIEANSFSRNMLCPYRWVADKIANREVLDFGCGYGFGAFILSRVAKEVLAYDVDSSKIYFGRENFIQTNLFFLDALPSKQFDIVTVFYVLNQVSDFDSSMQKIEKSMKKAGVLYISEKKSNQIILDETLRKGNFKLLEKMNFPLSDYDEVVTYALTLY